MPVLKRPAGIFFICEGGAQELINERDIGFVLNLRIHTEGLLVVFFPRRLVVGQQRECACRIAGVIRRRLAMASRMLSFRPPGRNGRDVRAIEPAPISSMGSGYQKFRFGYWNFVVATRSVVGTTNSW